MPSASVPMCCPARLSSARSTSISCWPVAKTCCGVFRLVSKTLPESDTRPRARPIVNSSSSEAFASMMNPRSAPVTSMAESITSASTSSSTRADPRARKPSSRDATCLKSATAEAPGPEGRG